MWATNYICIWTQKEMIKVILQKEELSVIFLFQYIFLILENVIKIFILYGSQESYRRSLIHPLCKEEQHEDC